MGIGIDIRVNRQQVTDAKREVELLADKASKLNDKEFTIVGGVNSGGPPGTDATVNAGAMDRTAKSAIAYRKEMEGTRRVVSDIAKDYDKLIKTMTSFRGAAATAAPGVGTVSSAESARMHKESQRAADAFWKDANEPRKRETAADRYFKEHGNYGRTVTSRVDEEASGGGSQASTMGNTIKKAVGWGLAAAGGFSLLGFLGSSRAQYQQAVGHEGRLYARGIKSGYNDGVSAGIDPLEQMQMLEGISQSTGMFGKKANSAANMSGRFAKYTGTDPSQVAGMYGTMYQATGNQQAGTGALSMMGEAIKKGMDKSRASELLQLVSRNTQATAQAMGGAGSDKQAGQATALAIEAMKATQSKADYAQYAKSGNFQNFMQNGLQGAGTAAGDIRLFQLMGGFKGPMNFEKIHDMNVMKQGGFMENPKLLSQLIGGLRSTTDKGKAGELETLLEAAGIKGAPAEKLIAMSKKDEKTGTSFFDRLSVALDGGKKKIGDLSKGSAEDKRIYAEWQKEIGKNPAINKEALEAKRQMVKIEAGEQLNKLFGKFEDGALTFASALTDQNWKGAFDSIAGAMKEAGPAGKLMMGAATLMFASSISNMIPGGAAGKAIMGRMVLPALTGLAAYEGTKFALDYFTDGTYGKDTGTTPTRPQAQRMSEAERIARQYKVRPSLVKAVIKAESGGDPNAVSDKGAKGLMQLMPETARDMGVRDPFNETQNMIGGVKYLKQMLDRYKGDEEKALAAYNAGPGNVDKAVKKDPKNWKKHLPQSKVTSGYVDTVEKYANIYDGAYRQEDIDRSPVMQTVLGPKYTDEVEERVEKTKKPGERPNSAANPATNAPYSEDYTKKLFDYITTNGIVVKPVRDITSAIISAPKGQ